jgi:hypothetical protein
MEERVSEEELSRRLIEAAQAVSVGARYKHYKGKLYKVISLAILEATNEICVIYQAQYGKNLTFIRPLTDWLEKVEWQGKTLNRFTKVD